MRYLVTLASHGRATTHYHPGVEIISSTIVDGQDELLQHVEELLADWGRSPEAEVAQQVETALQLLPRWLPRGRWGAELLGYLHTLWVDPEPLSGPAYQAGGLVPGYERRCFHALRKSEAAQHFHADQQRARKELAAEIRATNATGQTAIGDPDGYAWRAAAAGVTVGGYLSAVRALA